MPFTNNQLKYHKTSSIILAGLGVAAVGFAGKHLMRRMPQMTTKFNEALKNLPKFDAESMANAKYYKGGFDPKMNKREAALILGVSPSASKLKVSPNLFCIYHTKSSTCSSTIGKGCAQEDNAAQSS